MNPTRGEVDARIGETFLALNQIAASLALIERSCDRVLEELPVNDATLDIALALRAARLNAHVTLEQIGNVSDTLTTVLRFLSRHKLKEAHHCLSFVGAVDRPR